MTPHKALTELAAEMRAKSIYEVWEATAFLKSCAIKLEALAASLNEGVEQPTVEPTHDVPTEAGYFWTRIAKAERDGGGWFTWYPVEVEEDKPYGLHIYGFDENLIQLSEGPFQDRQWCLNRIYGPNESLTQPREIEK
jgi:hypothetical protein